MDATSVIYKMRPFHLGCILFWFLQWFFAMFLYLGKIARSVWHPSSRIDLETFHECLSRCVPRSEPSGNRYVFPHIWQPFLWYHFPKVNLKRTKSWEYVSKWSLLQSGHTLPSYLEPLALYQSPGVNLKSKFHKYFPPGVCFEVSLWEHVPKHIPQMTLLRIMCSRQLSETLSFLYVFPLCSLCFLTFLAEYRHVCCYVPGCVRASDRVSDHFPLMLIPQCIPLQSMCLPHDKILVLHSHWGQPSSSSQQEPLQKMSKGLVRNILIGEHSR